MKRLGLPIVLVASSGITYAVIIAEWKTAFALLILMLATLVVVGGYK